VLALVEVRVAFEAVEARDRSLVDVVQLAFDARRAALTERRKAAIVKHLVRRARRGQANQTRSAEHVVVA